MMTRWTLLLGMIALMAGCTQAKGQIRGEAERDWHVASQGDALCEAEVIRHDDPGVRRRLEKIGELDVEGGVWVGARDMERIARDKACEHGASLVSIDYESYAIPFRGSMASLSFYQ